jgi:hypothetical protein
MHAPSRHGHDHGIRLRGRDRIRLPLPANIYSTRVYGDEADSKMNDKILAPTNAVPRDRQQVLNDLRSSILSSEERYSRVIDLFQRCAAAPWMRQAATQLNAVGNGGR